MPLSNKDNPLAEPEAPKPAPKKAEPKAEPAGLVNAGESGDPDVHNLLARHAIASANGDEAGTAAAEAKLNELGFRI